MIIGIVDILIQMKKVSSDSYRINNFYNDFIKYSESGGSDYKTYDTLIKQSTGIQTLLGDTGIMCNYKPPYANYYYREIQVIVNFIPELKKSFREEENRIYSSGEIIDFYYDTVRECLIRFQGRLAERHEDLVSQLKNPFKIFNQGIKTILNFPFYVFETFGIISNDTNKKIYSSRIFNLIGAIISILGVLSAVITIVTGWNPFINFLKDLL